MSADNGIYIVKFPDGFRVAHAAAIDNCYVENEKIAEAYRSLYFHESELYLDFVDAHEKALEIEAKVGWTEYGVCEIEAFDNPIMDIREARNILRIRLV